MRETSTHLPFTRHEPTQSKDDLLKKDAFQPTNSPQRSSILKWWPEILGWMISVLIVAAIVGVLYAYNGATTVQWQPDMPITLNAALSLLVTFLYMALMVPIPKCIAQLKWNHYGGNRPRPLSDIEIFDEASRTVWGSAILLATRPNRLLAALGAFLTLAVAGVGPFVQQILSQEVVPRQIDGMTPTVPIFNWTSPYSGALTMAAPAIHDNVRVAGLVNQDIDGDAFDAAFYTGLIAPEARAFPVAPNCAAGNCTWSAYWTLVVESECRNLTDQLNSSWALPNNLAIDFDSASYKLLTKYPSVAFQDRGHLLSDFFYTASDSNKVDGESVAAPTATALECIFQLRAKKVQAVYINGVWSETQMGQSVSANDLAARGCSPWRRQLASGMFDLPAVTDVTGETYCNSSTQDPLASEWFSGGDPRKQETTTCNITIPTDSSSTNTSQVLIFPAIQLLNTAFRLFYLLGDDAGGIRGQAGGKTGGILNYLVSLVSKNPREQYLIDQSYNITFPERVDNIAKSLTEVLRTSYFNESILVSGLAHRDTVVYRVEWFWVTVPVALVALTLLLLVLTVWDTFHKGLQKRTDSSLALMVFGCDQEVRQMLAPVGSDLVAVTEAAKKQFVRLGPDHVLTPAKDDEESMIYKEQDMEGRKV